MENILSCNFIVVPFYVLSFFMIHLFPANSYPFIDFMIVAFSRHLACVTYAISFYSNSHFDFIDCFNFASDLLGLVFASVVCSDSLISFSGFC